MTIARGSARSIFLSIALAACGGEVADTAKPTPEPAPARTPAPSGGGVTSGSDTDSKGGMTIEPIGVVWVHAEGAGFDTRACAEPIPTSDFLALGEYVYTQLTNAGLQGAIVNAGGGQCHTVSPTSVSETEIFTGSAAAARSIAAAPPAPFKGTYLNLPIVVKQVTNVKFELYVGDQSSRAFEDVWTFEGLSFENVATFMTNVCNDKSTFDVAIAMSPFGGSVQTWLASRSVDEGYRLEYDATLTFDDGTTLKIADAHQAAGGPYFAPCPNFVASH